ncbi:MAG TPA: outer membrane protein assembly factor BamA [Pyrinomonadaceae bacterium]|nr:outer membrane protein assembly factor BamA [Pyrinomonadaceae bacterium]HMP66986.1 outer membrane protein assembly factor BamA [Pyrinomonadaceae bacterium]
MHKLRAFGLVILSLAVLCSPALAETDKTKNATSSAETETIRQQIVENVDIQGNRRLRDEDLIYWIRTRPGDVYDPVALERDLRELLSLNFFDKSATRVLTTPGIRGGVNVIFEVREWPIIRDLQFTGMKAVQESEVLKEFRERRAGIAKENVYDPVKARAASRILREMLASRGYPNASVNIKEEEVSATSIALTFEVDQGNRSRIVKIEFEGNERFKDSELRNALTLVRETGLVARVKGADILDMQKLQWDLQRNVRSYMLSKGYFQARIGEPEIEEMGTRRTSLLPLITLPIPLLSSIDDTLRIIVPITEGRLFRVGELKVEGNSIFSEQQILGAIGLKTGDVADGKRLQDAIYEDLKKVYGNQGFVNYNAELDPEFRDNPDNPNEGIVDITITIEEGMQFSLRRLDFQGNTFTRDRVLRREFLMNEGDIYNERALEISLLRLDQTQYFDPINKDQDVERRTDEERGDVDLIVKVKERGRQQISFNGGVGGLGGSFFGLEYSTNNLAGRGEILSFALGAGSRQQSLQVTYQEPYFRNRPISVGVSLFAARNRFFGEGTFLTQNTDLLNQLFDPFASVLTDEANLFTQNTYGVTLFGTAPLSELFFKKRQFTQFSRVGLTYQLTTTSISDPPINESADPAERIPVIYRQPGIITSRLIGTFVYDTRRPAANGIDTLSGSQLTLAFGLAGLGGDVRTYQPNASYSRFIPIRRKRSMSPEVFAFRIQAGTIGTFALTDKVRNANSLSFIGGIPVFERYYLGSENDIRGYNARAIGPIAPFDTYVTSRNVSLTANSFGDPVPVTGIPARTVDEIIQLGLLTGPDGDNPALFSRNFRFIGGDTQLLGNFEYRIPLFGPATMAVFADIGTVFNLRKSGIQRIDSEFLEDDRFLGGGRMTALSLINFPVLESSFGSILYYRGRIMTKTDFLTEFCRGNRAGCPTALSPEVQQLYLRGEAQQNSLLRVDDSLFNKIGDFRSSVGVEFRVQVPVVNVPFRLIYYYNPNGKFGFTQEAPGIFLPGKRNGFRFTVGRTF